MSDLSAASLSVFGEEDNIENYLERFELVCELNDVKDEVQMTKSLAVLGGKFLYDKIKVIVAPDVPSKVKYTIIKPKLLSALRQASMSNVEKAKFYSRVQNRGESVSEFAFQLKRIASGCNFGNSLDVILRDRFVFNLENEYIRRHTIRSEKVSFDEAVAEALLHESAAVSNQVSAFKSHSHVKKGHFSQNRSQSSQSNRSYKVSFQNKKKMSDVWS